MVSVIYPQKAFKTESPGQLVTVFPPRLRHVKAVGTEVVIKCESVVVSALAGLSIRHPLIIKFTLPLETTVMFMDTDLEPGRVHVVVPPLYPINEISLGLFEVHEPLPSILARNP
jgi:hypothetical protein